jgi:hypothetical protein
MNLTQLELVGESQQHAIDQMVTHPDSNHARRWLISMNLCIEHAITADLESFKTLELAM